MKSNGTPVQAFLSKLSKLISISIYLYTFVLREAVISALNSAVMYINTGPC